MTKKGKFSLKLFSVGAVAAIAIGMPSAGSTVLKADMLEGKGNYSADFESLDDAKDAAAQLSQSINEESVTLLKNKDDALPTKGDERVSIFGVSADNMIGTSQKLTDVFEEEGYAVNQQLKDYYAANGGSIGQEETEFTQAIRGSVNLYNDIGVVVLARDGAEGADLEMVTDEKEDNKYGTKDQGWQHKDLYKDADGNEYKHYLQLTDSEEALLEYVKSTCKKVVVVLNTSNIIEMGNIQNDPDIDAALWIGRPGQNGLSAVPKVLNGSVNPSGRTTDMWSSDFTADPSWINYGTGQQNDDITSPYYVEQDSSGDKNRFYYESLDENGDPIKDADGNIIYSEYNRRVLNSYSGGPDMFEGYSFTYYEEGIYNGYRYYETADAEAKAGNYAGFDYNKAVVYPFGYGLSYTSFDWQVLTTASDLTNWADKDTLEVQVKVTNTGKVAGKDVVQVYSHAPYTSGGIEKTENVLVGFDKTDLLQPGSSQILTITVDVQDIASFDSDDKNNNGKKTYELDAGDYELRFQTDSHNLKSADSKIGLSLAETTLKDTDPYTGATITAVLSNDDEYNSLGYDPATKKDLREEGKFEELSRSDFAATWPAHTDIADFSRSQEYFDWMMGRDLYCADETIAFANNVEDADAADEEGSWNGYTKKASGGTVHYSIDAAEDFGYSEDESDGATNQQPWVVSNSEFATKYSNWKQGSTDTNYKYSDMAGIDMNDTTNKLQNADPTQPYYTANAAMNGKTGAQVWEEFMNQLTYTELKIVVSNITSKALSSVGTPETPANDSPKNLGSTFDWGDEDHIAATFNTDLAEQEGIIVGNFSLFTNSGWYGPAMDGHRSEFGGRNNEYYSEDGYLAGMIGASVVSGAQSKGTACFIKHFALNEQETGRVHSSAIITEQAARELYFKQFKICVQKANAQWIMCSMGDVGDIEFGVNYNVMTLMLRDEWGFTGMVATDAWNPQKDAWPVDLMVRSGLNATLQDADTTGEGSSAKATYLVSGTYDEENNCVMIPTYVRDADGNIVYEEVTAEDGTVTKVAKTTTVKSNTQWVSVRNCAEQILYANVNSNYVQNFLDTASYSGMEELTAADQGKNYNASCAASFSSETISYSITDGELPAGLSLDANTGTISGTATEVGEFRITVEMTAENYITATKTFTIKVNSSFSLDADVSELEVGDEVDAYILNNGLINATDQDTTVEYAITSGELPAGLTLNGADGSIAGTLTTPGTYTANIHVTVTKKSSGGGGSSGGGSSTTTTEYDYVLTLTVGGEIPAAEYTENVPYIKDGNWYVNGVDTGVKATGENGADGKDGVDGKDGTNGTNGVDGKDGADGKDATSSGCGGSATAAAGLGLFGLIGALFLSKKRKHN